MLSAVEPNNSLNTKHIEVINTPIGLLVVDQSLSPGYRFNTYLLTNPQGKGLLAACWNQDFNHITDSMESPQMWAGYYNAAEKSLPTLARLIADTVSGVPDSIRVFKLIDPEDDIQKWFVGRQVESFQHLAASLNQITTSSSPVIPPEYRQLSTMNQDLLNEQLHLIQHGQNKTDVVKGIFKAMTAPPTIPMPSPSVFLTFAPPAYTPNRPASPSPKTHLSAQTNNKVVDGLEKIIDAGQAVSGNVGEFVGGSVLSDVIKNTADHVKAPFSEQSIGDQKVSRLMPIYWLIFIPFAILTMLASSAKPLGLGIAIIGLYFFFSAKAVLTPGVSASLAYFEGNKARIVGSFYVLFGLIIMIAI
jgi:hypothetical protein